MQLQIINGYQWYVWRLHTLEIVVYRIIPSAERLVGIKGRGHASSKKQMLSEHAMDTGQAAPGSRLRLPRFARQWTEHACDECDEWGHAQSYMTRTRANTRVFRNTCPQKTRVHTKPAKRIVKQANRQTNASVSQDTIIFTQVRRTLAREFDITYT